MTDKEILDSVVGGMAIRDMSAMTFYGWMSDKLNGVPAYKAATQELVSLVSAPPMSRLVPELEKVRIVRKLLELDVKL